MEAAFSSIAFADPARAETNLRLVEQRLPPGLWARLSILLAQVPDPDAALNNFERYLQESRPGLIAYLDQQPAAFHYLLLAFSHSRFLSETLVQQPDLILWLHRPAGRVGADRLARLRAPEDLREEFARFRATRFDLSPSVLLARFKRREYLRIMLRDILGLGTLAETTLELSHLADVILESALEFAAQKLLRLYGQPQFIDAAGRVHRSRLAVLSLGKLGGQELNYSSDIDLQFLYEEEGESAGGEAGPVPNAEFFSRLVAGVLKIITSPTAEGAVFRVDLRLRPEGSRGDVALSLPAALQYYRARARQWELQMLIKARPSAGDPDLGQRFLREVRPLIFHAESRRQALTAALGARREMELDLRRRSASAAARNVKLSPGGIRDIEFLAQCLQRIHGSTDLWLAASVTGSTLVALQRLHDKGHLTGRDFFRLGTAYQFFRNVEHRLQLRDGLQVHTLPSEAAELDRIARCLSIEPASGRSAGDQLQSRLKQHFLEVREIYDRVLGLRQVQSLESSATIESGSEAASSVSSVSAPSEAAGPLMRQIAGEHPALARAVLAGGWMQDVAIRRGLSQFLDAALLVPSLIARLESHLEWIPRIANQVALSDSVAAMLARHPEEIELIVEPDLAGIGLALDAARQASGGLESFLDSLRIAHRRALLILAARSVACLNSPFEIFAALTRVADQVLSLALHRLAAELVPGVPLDSAPFAVLALGRLGSCEMDLGSDVDLVFVTGEEVGAEQRGPWWKLAEKLVNVVSSHTRQGLLFPVDTRLRPRGVEGEMVQPLSYLGKYFRTEAAGWEAVTFAKGRPLAGNPALGAEAMARIHRELWERFAAGDGPGRLRAELGHMRKLVENEWRAQGGRGGLKLASGGYHDLEYILGYLALVGGLAPGGRNLLNQIRALDSANLLDSASAASLTSAATLFRSADHALRLVAGHSLDRTPDSATFHRASELLLQWRIPDADRFLQAIENRRAEVASLYDSLVRDS